MSSLDHIFASKFGRCTVELVSPRTLWVSLKGLALYSSDTMIEIRRRYNFDQWETIAYYEDGEFRGDQDFVDSFDWLEDHDEELIMEELDGPDLLAVRPEDAPEADATAVPDDVE